MNARTIKRIQNACKKVETSEKAFFGGNPNSFRYKYVDGDETIIICNNKILMIISGKRYGASLEEIQKIVGTEQLKLWLNNAKNEIGNPKPYYSCAICGTVIFDQNQVYCNDCRESGWKLDRKKLEKATFEAYEGLAQAVLSQVVNDYEKDLKKLTKAARNLQEAKKNFVNACHKFDRATRAANADEKYFYSESFEILSMGMLSPDAIVFMERAEALEKMFKEL